jgi:transcriptional regulator with XRE-family HTH domain
MSTFGERLRVARLRKGLKQKDLASMLNISQATIARYENNQHEPDIEMLKKLSTALEVSVDYLLGQTEELATKNAEQKKSVDQEEVGSPKPNRLTIAELLQRFADRDPETLTVEEALDMVLRSDHVMFDGVPVGHELDEDVLLDIRDAMVYFLKFLLKQSRLTTKKAPRWAGEVVGPRRQGAERLAG